MKRKSFIAIFLTITLALMAFTFLGLNEVEAQDGEYVINLAHADAMDVYKSRKHAQCVAFKNLVESNSSGRIDVKIHGGGSVGGEREYVESVMAGSLQAGIASGVIANFYPPAMVNSIPYLYPNARVAWEVLDGPFGDRLSEGLLEETGLRNLAFAEVGFRHFTNSKRPIHSPEDMEGLKIRVMETPIYVKLVEALGANPTPIAWNECYSALQTGVVDGEENPVSTIVFANFAEVQDYLTLDGHTYGVDWFVMNNDFYTSLPSDLQRIVDNAAKISSTVGRGLQQLNSAVGLGTLNEAGMEIYKPTPEEKEAFKEAAQQPVIDWLKNETEVDPQLVDDLLERVDQVSEELGV